MGGKDSLEAKPLAPNHTQKILPSFNNFSVSTARKCDFSFRVFFCWHVLWYSTPPPRRQGPQSRLVLERAIASTAGPASRIESKVSDAALPFRGAVELEVGFASVLCARITYVGELGFELYCAAEQVNG